MKELDHENFDRLLQQIIDTYTPSQLMLIPGIYEVLAEEFNNDVIELWEQENE